MVLVITVFATRVSDCSASRADEWKTEAIGAAGTFGNIGNWTLPDRNRL
jgi:hypothetical protein